MLGRLLRYVVLPRDVSTFEVAYLRRVNRIAFAVFWLHVPLFSLIAAISGDRIERAAGLGTVVMMVPTIAYVTLQHRQRMLSTILGVTAMLLGGVLVFLERGPMQIEMHFYFFVLLALLTVFGNPTVILAAAVTVCTHHLVLWFVRPDVVFNYEASWVSLVVHTTFLVLESVAAIIITRTYFDNVISLERDKIRILDNVAQGLVTLGYDGSIGAERSHALEEWFGVPPENLRWWDYVGATEKERAWIRLGFDGLVEDFMPIEATLDQFPKLTARNGRQLSFEYRPIGPQKLLVVVTDVTSEMARRDVERSQRELVSVFERATHDQAGFAAFLREGAELVAFCVKYLDDRATTRRHLHTLKGNAALFGVESITELAHELESALELQTEPLSREQRGRLATTWQAFEARMAPLGLTRQRNVVVPREEYDAVVRAIEPPAPPWAQRVQQWGLDPARAHLERLADQAVKLAERLDKAKIVTRIDDNNIRLDQERYQPLWAALVHAVRNAVSHGIETTDERRRAGKPASAHVTFSAKIAVGSLIVEVRDDGAGIDWAAVELKAQDQGLPTATRRDLSSALFTGRVSTALTINEIAGRGVGLDALQTACRRLGGDVLIESERGQGTTVRCVVALAEPTPKKTRAA